MGSCNLPEFSTFEEPLNPMDPESLFRKWSASFTWYSEAKNNGFPNQISSRPYNNLNIPYLKLFSYLNTTCLPLMLFILFPSNLRHSYPNTFFFFLFFCYSKCFRLLHHNELYITSLMLYCFFLSLTKAVLPLINPPSLRGPQKLWHFFTWLMAQSHNPNLIAGYVLFLFANFRLSLNSYIYLILKGIVYYLLKPFAFYSRLQKEPPSTSVLSKKANLCYHWNTTSAFS